MFFFSQTSLQEYCFSAWPAEVQGRSDDSRAGLFSQIHQEVSKETPTCRQQGHSSSSLHGAATAYPVTAGMQSCGAACFPVFRMVLRTGNMFPTQCYAVATYSAVLGLPGATRPLQCAQAESSGNVFFRVRREKVL